MFGPFLLSDALGVLLAKMGRKAVICLPLMNSCSEKTTARYSGKISKWSQENACCPSPVTSQLMALTKS